MSDAPKNCSQLARALGVSNQLIAYHRRKRPDCPKTFDVEEWKTYLAATGRDESAPADIKRAIASARLELVREQRDKLRTENQVRSRELMPVADAKSFIESLLARQIQILRQRLENELPVRMAGLDVAQARAEAQKVVDEILAEHRVFAGFQ